MIGKTNLAIALGYAAFQHGYSVLFANAVDTINTLSAAQAHGVLKTQLKRYLSPALLVLDEVDYLPMDQHGADLFFQVISQRYERGSIVITSNKAFKQWPTQCEFCSGCLPGKELSFFDLRFPTASSAHFLIKCEISIQIREKTLSPRRAPRRSLLSLSPKRTKVRLKSLP